MMQTSPSQSMTVLADMPPPYFDEIPLDAPHAAPPTLASPYDVSGTPLKRSRIAIRIARAIAGDTEVRLLEETGSGSKAVYYLETASLNPYTHARVELTGRGKRPVTAAKAVDIFEAAVISKYPPEILPNGKVVAIHLNLK